MRQKLGDARWRVGEVAIHGEQQVVAMFICPEDTRAVRAADALLSGPMDHIDVRVFARKAIYDLAGPVRRIVVQEIKISSRGLSMAKIRFYHLFQHLPKRGCRLPSSEPSNFIDSPMEHRRGPRCDQGRVYDHKVPPV